MKFRRYYDHFLLHLNELNQTKSLYKEQLTFWKKYIKNHWLEISLKNYSFLIQILEIIFIMINFIKILYIHIMIFLLKVLYNE